MSNLQFLPHNDIKSGDHIISRIASSGTMYRPTALPHTLYEHCKFVLTVYGT